MPRVATPRPPAPCGLPPKLVFAAALVALVTALAAAALAARPSPAEAASGEAAVVAKTTDPSTATGWEGLLGGETGGGPGVTFSTADAGRIWLDKSVFGSTADAQAAGIPVTLEDEQYGFLVSLSALSAAATVQSERGPAHDVVFVVSTNRTLSDMTYNGQPSAAYLASALNSAIARLMAQNDGASTPTRVSVIGYDSDVVTLMPLGTYEPDAQGDYVAFTPGVGGTGGTLDVVATGTSGEQTSSASFDSGSYLQRAAYLAGEELVGAATDGAAADREPEMVVLGVQVPPMASPSFEEPPAFDGAATGMLGPVPGTRANGFGTDAAFATLLTIRQEVDRVNAAWAAAGAPGTETNLCTVGLDTSGMGAYLLQTASGQAGMDVAGSGAAAGTNLEDNLASAASQYAQAAAAGDASVTLPLYGSGPLDLVASSVTFPCVAGLLDEADGYALSSVDECLPSYSAASLAWTFGTAVDRMLGIEYDAPTATGDAGLTGGSIGISDEVGAGMQVTRVDGIVYGAQLLDGSGAAQAVAVSLRDPYDIEATHEFNYLVETMNERYDLGYAVYDLFFDALGDGQFAYSSDGSYSNHASWFVNASHGMVPLDGRPYAFATQEEVRAVADGTWQTSASAQARSGIEAAQAAGATAVCEAYFYIGDFENPYSGGDVTLYDFAVMVETSLSTGRQTVLVSVPADAIPALRASVTMDASGSATMALDGNDGVGPLRIAYELSPTPAVTAVLEAADAGEPVTDAELSQAVGQDVPLSGDGRLGLYASGFSGTGATAQAGAVVTAQTAATNPSYAFAQDTPLLELRPGMALAAGAAPTADQLQPLSALPTAGETYYYAQVVYSATFSTASVGTSAVELMATSGSEAGGTVAPATATTRYVPYVAPADGSASSACAVKDGTCVALAGTPAYPSADGTATREKSANATGSAPYAELLSVGAASGGGVLLTARLGNNGLLAIPSENGLGSLAITCEVKGQPTDGSGKTSFSYEVRATTATGTPVTGTYACEVGGETTDVTFSDGLATVSVPAGATATLLDLPAGGTVSVTQEDASEAGYATTPALTQETGVPASGTAGLTFVNAHTATPEEPTDPEEPADPEEPTDPEDPVDPERPGGDNNGGATTGGNEGEAPDDETSSDASRPGGTTLTEGDALPDTGDAAAPVVLLVGLGAGSIGLALAARRMRR